MTIFTNKWRSKIKNILIVGLSLFFTINVLANYLGNYNNNSYGINSTGNEYGAGNKYKSNSINNEYGEYGSKYSNKSVNNPYATNAPKLYDSQGNYRGRLNTTQILYQIHMADMVVNILQIA
ncbi:hypothetical protein [Bathymodiolus thermophilus thioautotrophic gill symbiont]|uniref:hypothetical protein n=1 Tax=Bathymodiolus thermophilus thioautotrophic gill symbiont TaxID=2360 RepID=UPI0019D2F2AC|nr:hypothetical protein [Bathymodiolus thermophilus thioautotrophic gill symbiont]